MSEHRTDQKTVSFEVSGRINVRVRTDGVQDMNDLLEGLASGRYVLGLGAGELYDQRQIIGERHKLVGSYFILDDAGAALSDMRVEEGEE